MRDTRCLAFGVGLIIVLASASGLLLVASTAGNTFPENEAQVGPLSKSGVDAARPFCEVRYVPTEDVDSPCVYLPLVYRNFQPDMLRLFYGVQYVPIDELEMVKELGIEVVLMDFEHDGPPEIWLVYLDEAQAQGIQVVAWLWPQGWSWEGTAAYWHIDGQAQEFIQTVAGHPALLAVYSLHEPYWMGCEGCGYTTAEQQALYDAIKAIADVPIWSGVDSMAFWTEQGEETAFADGVCDYCETWYYPFLEDGTYERDKVISQLTADLAVARQRAPNSKVVWAMQSFAQGAPYYLRMPEADEMRDLASIVYSTDIDGALWYVWTFGDLYSDFLSNHPELYLIVQEVYEDVVLPIKR
jgi:hypothetical protein